MEVAEWSSVLELDGRGPVLLLGSMQTSHKSSGKILMGLRWLLYAKLTMLSLPLLRGDPQVTSNMAFDY